MDKSKQVTRSKVSLTGKTFRDFKAPNYIMPPFKRKAKWERNLQVFCVKKEYVSSRY